MFPAMGIKQLFELNCQSFFSLLKRQFRSKYTLKEFVAFSQVSVIAYSILILYRINICLNRNRIIKKEAVEAANCKNLSVSSTTSLTASVFSIIWHL